MVAASILPVAIHKGNLYFLFGKENEMEDSSIGFSDFGGGVEDGESIMETALREGSEELCGFLGDSESIKKLLKSGIYTLVHDSYHIHIFLMEYDKNLPCYFTNHHQFLWERMNKKVLNDSKYFEKQEICWFSIDDMRTHISLFRNFYQEMVNMILDNKKEITAFVKKINKRKGSICSLSKTRKRIKGG
jgi:8-oxo-dGTP pyrophosphatase MutT (NUDIX family)